MTRIAIYDTTLRDGSQGEGINFSLADKLLITERLAEFGVDYIEGGYPLSNPKDAAYFREARRLDLGKTKIAAFGMTRRRDIAARDDIGLKALAGSGAPVLTVVGKSWDLQVREVLGVSLDENLRMIEDSVAFLAANAEEVVYDAEHFFDGFIRNGEYALKTLEAAVSGGAKVLVLCDTNGGSLPEGIERAVAAVRERFSVAVGIHTHNDCDLAVANTLIAVRQGAVHVQGTINGIGERCGNVDLCSVIANLALKYDGFEMLDPESLRKLTELSRYVHEIANMNFRSNQPFVGPSAFAHKGGMHVHGIRKNAVTYEHINPELVGNERRILVSELSGKSTIAEKFEDFGFAENPKLLAEVLERVQDLENEGWQFEAAEASFRLLVERIAGGYQPRFERLGWRVSVADSGGKSPVTEATLKVRIGDCVEHVVGEGDGPVAALDNALRKALEPHFPGLAQLRLVDYKVRVINPREAAAARVRVVIESRDHEEVWGTVGVSENVIEASWMALIDSFEHKLARDAAAVAPPAREAAAAP